MDNKIISFVLWAGGIMLWGFLISIGFWTGHKFTNKIDRIIGDIVGKKIARKHEHLI